MYIFGRLAKDICRNHSKEVVYQKGSWVILYVKLSEDHDTLDYIDIIASSDSEENHSIKRVNDEWFFYSYNLKTKDKDDPCQYTDIALDNIDIFGDKVDLLSALYRIFTDMESPEE